MLRDCVVLAVEGTHASGKTTLTHALTAYYRERGIHVAAVEEPARHSPFIEEIIVHGKGQFDLETEVDLFAAQLSAQLRAARTHTMIIADKTIANVMAYAWLVLQTPAEPDRCATGVVSTARLYARGPAMSGKFRRQTFSPMPARKRTEPGSAQKAGQRGDHRGHVAAYRAPARRSGTCRAR